MKLEYRQLAGYPILIFEIQGQYTVEDTREIYRITTDFKKKFKFIYRIADVSASESTYVDMLDMIRLAANDSITGSYKDPDVMVIVVTNDRWTEVMPTVMETPPFQGVTLPMFKTQTEAIEYAKLHHSLYYSEYHSHDDRDNVMS